PYTYSWAGVTAGSYSITAKAYDNLGANTTSAAITITVVAPVSVGTVYEHCNFGGYAVNLSLGNYTAAQLVALGGKDNDISSVKVQSGYQMILYSEDNFLGTSLVISADNSCLVGNSFNDVATSIKVVVQTANTAPIVNITSPVNNASFNAPASVTINANASDADGSISKVEFYNGTTLLGTDVSSPYSFVWNNVAAGNYTLSAKATDNAGAVASSTPVSVVVKTVVVNQAPSVNITSPAANTSFNAPASVTINANASDADGSIIKVEFYNGSTLLGSDVSSPYSYVWSNVAAGTYSINVKATDNSGAVTTSGTVIISVKVVTTDACSGKTAYAENGGYVAGSRVQNAGSLYECKPYPYSGWCNGAAWAYAPGTGAYWSDAWTLISSCAATAAPSARLSAEVFSPNPATDIINFNTTESSHVTLIN
ncbi:MAG: hypothetical protein EOP51_31920, partial [Sphingobacteriales bacterium]